MLGPGEFFAGLALGGRQFFSGTLGRPSLHPLYTPCNNNYCYIIKYLYNSVHVHCIGGLGGVVGKMTGVLGDAAAKLTMDTEYQETRRRRGGGDAVGRSLVGAGKVQ